MIMDKLTEFCDATPLLLTGTGKLLIGNVIDTSEVRDHGQSGIPVYLNLRVLVAPLSALAATVSFILASDAQAAIAVDGTATEHIVTMAFPKATLVVGYTLAIPLPLEGSNTYERYLGILQNVGVAVLTAGTIDAFLSLNAPAWKAVPDGIN